MSADERWQRHFLALAPDEAAVRALGSLAIDPAARRVAPDDLHATLAFLGTLDPEGETRALDAAREAAAEVRAPLRVDLRRVERWRNAWVVCDDGHAPDSPLRQFASALAAALGRVGFGPPDHPFRAHVTVARAGGGEAPRPLELASPIVWEASEVVLLASRPSTPPGALRYHPRGRLRIG